MCAYLYIYIHTYIHAYIYIYIHINFTHIYIMIKYYHHRKVSWFVRDRVSWAEAAGECKWWPFPTVFNSTFTILHTNSKIRCRRGIPHENTGDLHKIAPELLQGSRQLQVSTVSGDGPYMGDGVLVMPSGFLGSFRKVKAYSIAMASTLALVLGCFEMW